MIKSRGVVVGGFAVALVFGLVRASEAQATSSIRWYVSVSLALDGADGNVTLIGEQPEIELTLHLGNTQGPDVWNIQELPSRVRVSVATANQIVPVHLTAMFDPDVRDQVLPEGRDLWLRVGLRRQDGQPFGPALYGIVTDLTEFLGSLKFADGSAWHGAEVKRLDTRRVMVKQFATFDEHKAKLSREGNKYLNKGMYAEAIAALEELVQLAPGQWQAHGALGAAYLRSGQFQQAASSLERALPGFMKFNPRGQGIVAGDLAAAYVRLGRDADAARALRSVGVAPQDIPGRLERMR